MIPSTLVWDSMAACVDCTELSAFTFTAPNALLDVLVALLVSWGSL